MNGAILSLPAKLFSKAQCKEMDRLWIAQSATTAYQLMCRAGLSLWQLIEKKLSKTSQETRIIVLAGLGNNGGDGFVVARLAHQQGCLVTVIISGSLTSLTTLQGATLQAVQACQTAGVSIEAWSGQLPLADIYVDALIGIGFSAVLGQVAPVRAPINDMIMALNQRSSRQYAKNAPVQVYAVDLPSGLDADRGKVSQWTVKADVTLKFISCQPGLLTGSARDCVGVLWFDNLGVPESIESTFKPVAVQLSLKSLSSISSDSALQLNTLKRRAQAGHKGDYGHVLVIGGDLGFGGAAILAAEAALSSGAGKVSLVTHADHLTAALARMPEVMVLGVSEDVLHKKWQSKIQALIQQASVVVLGPGLGTAVWGQQLAQWSFQLAKKLVLDADALNLVTHRALDWTVSHTPCVITPHPKEAAGLLEVSTAQVEQDRFLAAQQLRERYHAQVVLKGAGTLIYSFNGSEQKVHVVNAGNPGMATAGTGDVLAGLLGGLIAQGLAVDQAAVLAPLLHAVAGDAVVLQQGVLSMKASDLLEALTVLLK